MYTPRAPGYFYFPVNKLFCIGLIWIYYFEISPHDDLAAGMKRYYAVKSWADMFGTNMGGPLEVLDSTLSGR